MILKDEHLKSIEEEFRKIGFTGPFPLWLILHHCTTDFLFAKSRPRINLSTHQDRLADIAAAARRLKALLEAERDTIDLLYYSYLEDPDEDLFPDHPADERTLPEFDTHWLVFSRFLERLVREATATYSDLGRLKQLRRGYSVSVRKSPQHLYLWLPIFKLWAMAGGKLGFSVNGPIMRILKAVHSALGIAPPSPESVRHAIREFKAQR